MGKAAGKGIPLARYLNEHSWAVVCGQLNRRELRFEWKDATGATRASDDGGSQPPPGWWRPEFTIVNRVTSEVREHASWIFKPHERFQAMHSVKVYPEPVPPPTLRAEARRVSHAAVVEAIIDQKDWILAQRPKEREIRRQIEAIVGGAVSRKWLRALLPAFVPERQRGRPRVK
jgi:hypothetical protein